jgi:hypothetical protein
MALACGATAEAAASKAGVSVRTVYNRRQDPEFNRLLNKTRADLVKRTTDMLTGGGGEAVKTLLTVMMREQVPANVRVAAARALLEMGDRFREKGDLAERIAALEAQRPPGPRLANGTES